MDDSTTWRELHRCDDLLKARAIAAAISSMEFEARLVAVGAKPARFDRDEENRGTGDDASTPDAAELHGPYVIEVPDDDWPTLRSALNEIIAEQDEFDRALLEREDARNARLMKAAIVIAIVASVYGSYQLIVYIQR